MSFGRALDHVLRYEGGYVDDPRDPGGATNMGITLGTLADWRAPRSTTKLDVQALTRDEAAAIYRARYWTAMRCDEWRPCLALMMFDCAVNQGVGRAARLLQAAAGVTMDGTIGPKTVHAVMAADARALTLELAARRMVHYASLPTFSTFGTGWSRRLMATLAEALEMVDVRTEP